MSKSRSRSKQKEITVEERYEKKTQHQHILLRPDSYVGSVECNEEDMWVWDEEVQKIVYKKIQYIPALYKIYDEIIVNARDHSVRDKTCRSIKIDINKDTGEISCMNNGNNGIPVIIHKKHNIYVPELIFSHLLTSENYNDNEKRIVGGKNGYGSKIANIYSKHFYIEVFDSKNKKLFKQHFRDNMYTRGEAVVEDLTGKKQSYCLIKFTPDYEKFGVENLSDDMYNLFIKRAYDIVACTAKSTKVYINKKLVKINNFEEYTDMFFDKPMPKVYYEEPNKRWKVCAVYDPDTNYRHVSYVNGICTYHGGSHVSHVINQLIDKLKKIIHEKYKDLTIKTSLIKDNLTIFIDATIENPGFNGQTKELLTNKVATFGSKCSLPDDFVKQLSKTGITNEVINMAQVKSRDKLKESDGKKVKKIRGMAKLEDARYAATIRSKKCNLILTEGDSAKTFAISGLSVIGSEYYGVFPLKGKLLNVRDATVKQLLNNEEIKNLKKILGLKENKIYDDSNIKELRYGGIIVLTDADVDGSHIKGLIINFIEFFWPSLLQNFPDFVRSMSIPIIKAIKGARSKETSKIFYTLTEYENWQKTSPKGWKIKYYKGLGTYTDEEAIECFESFPDNIINYVWGNDESPEAIDLAFNKKRSDDRKKWLLNYRRDNIIDNINEKDIPFSDFINKDLIHFSKYDVERSVPAIDGLKPSQRKVLYVSFKKNILNKEIKVAQLGGYVSAESNYHHGETSLFGTIIKMAQNYVGSNNINTLLPNGQFGSRLLGGKDSASPRYIFTQLNRLTPLIYRHEDACVLDYVNDDGDIIEPIVYAPIIPMVLVNGCLGIGTGFSSNIPCYNPRDIIANIKLLMKGKRPTEMRPWYRNFKGNITKVNSTRYRAEGVYKIINKNTVHITELPISTWTTPYKAELDKIMYDEKSDSKKKPYITDYISVPSNKHVDITVTFIPNVLQKLIKDQTIEKVLQLRKNICISNMHLHLPDGSIKKYETINEILTDYYSFRLNVYAKRKEFYTKKLEHDLNITKYKIKFIEYVIAGKIKVMINKKSRKRQEVIDDLEKHKFPKLSKRFQGDNESYDYLTDIKIFDLTVEELEKLKKEHDEKQTKYDTYVNTSIEDIWLAELLEFEKAYNKWIVEDEKNHIIPDKKSKGKRGARTRRKRN